MVSSEWPGTHEVAAVFEDEVRALGGCVTDTVDDGSHLYLRSVLPESRETRPGDGIQAGVALRMVGGEILIHPYLYRLVCKNGAIWARTLATTRLEMGETRTVEDVAPQIREAVRACAAPEVFRGAMEAIGSSQRRLADLEITLLSWMSGLPGERAARLLRQIVENFSREADLSAFGLMNAVTALARDTADAELRWRLEELGGGIPALLAPVPGRVLPEREAPPREHATLMRV